MKTKTRSKIIEIVQKKGQARPVELRDTLQISGQALHRHLSRLVENGVLEVKGSPPLTWYTLAGIPDLDAVTRWLQAPTLAESPQSFVCETRDILTARLPNLTSLVKKGLPETLLPLVISTIGEIGNNSFDHNIGHWRDVPGCWFETQVTGGKLWICLADRGQGIFQSLVRVHTTLADDQEAIKMAFETVISGRSPEKRGNGLKFVRENLSGLSGSGLACISGTGRIFYGDEGEGCLAFLTKYFTRIEGTMTLLQWRLQ